jgi:hypothetical protein
VPNNLLSWEWLDEVGQQARATKIIGADSPWESLFTIGWPAHRELTLELYYTFVFCPRAPRDPEPNEIEFAEGRVEAEVSFRMFGFNIVWPLDGLLFSATSIPRSRLKSRSTPRLSLWG